jgi:hypothetical protein
MSEADRFCEEGRPMSVAETGVFTDHQTSDSDSSFVDVLRPTNRVTDFSVQSILARPATADTMLGSRVRNPVARPPEAATKYQPSIRGAAPASSSSSLRAAGSPHAVYGSTLVERYIYSLPEYRVRRHQRNFIEICSFNGLLATRKVIGRNRTCRLF